MVEGWTRAGSSVELVLGGAIIACSPNALPRRALDALANLTFEELPATAAPAAGVDVWAEGGTR